MTPTLDAVSGITFAMTIPWPLWLAIAAASTGILGFGLWRRAGSWRRGLTFRAILLMAGLLALANPTLDHETRTVLPDIMALVIDDSASAKIGARSQIAEAAAAELGRKLKSLKNLEVRTVRVGGLAQAPGGEADGTALIGALDRALTGVAPERFAGAIMITDGQVHDTAEADGLTARAGPVHVLLTGQPNEHDRRLIVESAPSFGIVGEPLTLKLRVDDGAAEAGASVEVTINQVGKPAGQDAKRLRLRIGQSHSVQLALERAGANPIEISVEAGAAELTLQNNLALVEVNGVRERLRVLLISGLPHAGERVWRNLLKSDPSVDLVHFTILRSPEKQDGTPARELSLIAFPVQELFEEKLSSFDLVIFDQYRQQGILPQGYYELLARYVRAGGALLEASGPMFATDASLYRTAVGDVLPGRPSGAVHLGAFRPTLTAAGQRHPVTGDLPGAQASGVRPPDIPLWGRWLRMVDVQPAFGDVVIAGFNERPLLLLARVDQGRVAQLTSDQAWLWARGFDGGGPQAELLRRLVHWLMREPDLEENDLRARVKDGRIAITRRHLAPDDKTIALTAPNGEMREIELEPGVGGKSSATVSVEEPGLYRISDGVAETLALVGGQNSKEFSDVRATADLLGPIARATGGGVVWLARDGVPDLRRIAKDRSGFGRGWIGLEEKGDFRIIGIEQQPLLPAAALLLLTLGALLLAWWREGR
jgi:hypothetical protein